MPFIIMQQVQPSFIMVMQQSQQAWIMSVQALSPLVQVMQQPFSIISHLHMPIIRLQQQTIIPFIIMQQVHMPPAIMVQRFCIMVHDTLSSHVQVIFMPPSHFSILMVQRGIIMVPMPAGIMPVMPVIPLVPIMPPCMPVMPVIAPRFIIMLTIAVSPVVISDSNAPPPSAGASMSIIRATPSPCKGYSTKNSKCHHYRYA
jgi:hypothetical protein